MSRPAPEPLALTGANVRTLEAADTVAQAVLLRAGRIACVGTDADVREAAGESARIADLAGKTVLPGLIDAHTHLDGTSVHLAYFADCHAPPHTDLAGILGALAGHAAPIPKSNG